MKKAYLSIQAVRQALSFLTARKEHANAIKNKDWEAEFENCLRVIEELAVVKR